MCDDGTNCVPLRNVCNGRQDCYNGADELNCSSSSNDNTHVYQVSYRLLIYVFNLLRNLVVCGVSNTL